MIKRNESQNRKKRRINKKRRRLLMEDLEDRRLLAGDTGVPAPPTNPLPTFDAPRNIGTVAAFTHLEEEAPPIHLGKTISLQMQSSFHLAQVQGRKTPSMYKARLVFKLETWCLATSTFSPSI